MPDIGKNIVCFMLDVNGFEVIDLGVDVRPRAFIDAIRAYTGAESFGLNAMNAVSDCKKWIPAKAA